MPGRDGFGAGGGAGESEDESGDGQAHMVQPGGSRNSKPNESSVKLLRSPRWGEVRFIHHSFSDIHRSVSDIHRSLLERGRRSARRRVKFSAVRDHNYRQA
jgi:hypothetical protein